MWVTVQLDLSASASASQGHAGSKLQAAKTQKTPPGLGALVSDLVEFEVDVGDGTVGLQGICERLSGDTQGRNCTLQRPRDHRLALAPSSPILFSQRLILVTVRLDFRASASASQGHAGSKLQAAKTPWAPPGLGTFLSDVGVIELDLGYGAVELQCICECLAGAKRGRPHRLR